MKTIQAGDIMTATVTTIGAQESLTELERTLARARVSGVPVVDAAGELVGVVSRADVVRALSGAAADADAMLAYYRDVAGADPAPAELARMAGEQAGALRVEQVMATVLVTVRREQPLPEVARMLVEQQVHRALVTEGRRLLGVVSSLDIVRTVADGRLVPAP